jgi:hypothetical protein
MGGSPCHRSLGTRSNAQKRWKPTLSLIFMFSSLFVKWNKKIYLMKEWLKLEGRGLFLGPLTLHCPPFGHQNTFQYGIKLGPRSHCKYVKLGPKLFRLWSSEKSTREIAHPGYLGRFSACQSSVFSPASLVKLIGISWNLQVHDQTLQFSVFFKVFEISNRWLCNQKRKWKI